MPMKNFCAWLAGTLLLAGCHKDKEAEVAPDLTGTYTASATVRAAHPIVLYTKDGQVNDQNLINRFLKRQPSFFAEYFSATDQTPNTGAITQLAFRGNGRATLLTSYSSYKDSVLTKVVARPAGGLLLQYVDTTGVYTNIGLPCDTRINALAVYVRNFNAPTQCTALNPATGYSQYCRINPIRLVGVRDGQPFIPYLSWCLRIGTCSFAQGGEWNTFNPAILSRLVAGDTLVVQEREIALQK